MKFCGVETYESKLILELAFAQINLITIFQFNLISNIHFGQLQSRGIDVEPQRRRGVEAAEAAEEDQVGGVAEPGLADEGGAD